MNSSRGMEIFLWYIGYLTLPKYFSWCTFTRIEVWNYHQGPQQAECSCKALLYPYDSASACSPPPALLQLDSWRWHKPGRQVSYGMPSKNHYTLSGKTKQEKNFCSLWTRYWTGLVPYFHRLFTCLRIQNPLVKMKIKPTVLQKQRSLRQKDWTETKI